MLADDLGIEEESSMPRGFAWSLYVDDTGASWSVRVDADYALDPDRGWQGADPNVVTQLPRGWSIRRVLGVDDEGNEVFAGVATTDAPLWTGAAPAFTFNATDQLAHTATVIAMFAERRLPRGAS